MALFKNPFGGNLVTNLAIGVGLVIVTPFVVPLIAKIVRPAVKGAVKGGLLLTGSVAGRGTTDGEKTGAEPVGKRRGVSQAAHVAAGQSFARPLAVKAVKGGILAYEKSREVLSEAAEGVRGLAAKAKVETAPAVDTSPATEEGEGASPLKSVKPPRKNVKTRLAVPRTKPLTTERRTQQSRKSGPTGLIKKTTKKPGGPKGL